MNDNVDLKRLRDKRIISQI